MRISLHYPIHLFLRNIVGTRVELVEEKDDNDTLQDRLRAQVERKKRRDITKSRIDKNLGHFQCAICLMKQETLKNNPLCVLPCGHAYHMSCVVQLILTSQVSHKCPLCRFKIENGNEIEYIT